MSATESVEILEKGLSLVGLILSAWIGTCPFLNVKDWEKVFGDSATPLRALTTYSGIVGAGVSWNLIQKFWN